MLRSLFNLTRPLIGLDLETHAFVQPEQSHICEIGFKVLYPEGKEPKRWVSYVKPPVPITEEATAKHHITNEMVAEAPLWSQLAPNIAHGFRDCDFVGYNIRFDLRVMYAEMQRVNVAWSYTGARLLDGFRLWQVSEPRTLSDALEKFCDRKPTEAHRALGDAEDAMDAAYAILMRYQDRLPKDLTKLHEMCFKDSRSIDPDGKFVWSGTNAVFNFGKHAGVGLRNVPKGYLEWMLAGSFSPEVKKIVADALDGQFPRKETS